MFSFFSKKQLQPVWAFRTEGIIWRFLFSSETHLVIEERLKEMKSTRFLCLDFRDGLPVWKDFSLDENWYSGLETVQNGTVYLHGYADPQLPEHLGIYAVSLATGDLLWYRQDLAFYHAGGGHLAAYRQTMQDRTFLLLDPVSGTETGELTQDEADAFRGGSDLYEGFGDVSWPSKLMPNGDLFPDFAELIEKETGHKILAEHGLDVLEAGDSVVFGFHFRGNKDGLSYGLTVTSGKTGKSVLSRVLAVQLKGQAGDLFLLKGNLLMVVAGPSELVCYRM